VRLEPLYRVTFRYPEHWHAELNRAGANETAHFFVADGRCEGRISGRFRGANAARRRADGTYVPDFQGAIETDDGATILFALRGYGRSYPEPNRQVVGSVTHASGDERYLWLNDVVCPVAGEVRRGTERGTTRIVLDVAELVWEEIR
jgi:hypothetical protein